VKKIDIETETSKYLRYGSLPNATNVTNATMAAAAADAATFAAAGWRQLAWDSDGPNLLGGVLTDGDADYAPQHTCTWVIVGNGKYLSVLLVVFTSSSALLSGRPLVVMLLLRSGDCSGRLS
jgi:hypothetical protein